MEELAAAGFDLHRSLSVDLAKHLQDAQSTHGYTPAPLEYRRISHLHLLTHEYQQEHLEHEMAVFKEHCEADGGDMTRASRTFSCCPAPCVGALPGST